jgi:hypothetical protein
VIGENDDENNKNYYLDTSKNDYKQQSLGNSRRTSDVMISKSIGG